MDASLFIDKTTGQLVEISNLRDAKYAFVPASLPPMWEWSEKLWSLLIRAHRAVVALDSIGTYLPDPQLVLQPLQFREAVRSSSLEGTYTEPIQQALFELDPESIGSDEPSIDSYREISNYGHALRLYFESREKTPISLHLIRQLHHILLKDVRGGDKEPGRFRQVQNQIGRPPRFIPPPPEHLVSCLEDFESYIRINVAQYAPLHDLFSDEDYNPIYDPLVHAFIVHYQFETIHSFLDGNGRVGRLLLSIMITEGCRMSSPWLQMSPYFDANKDEYIDRLFAVSSQGKWFEWIKFCLTGVIAQAQDTQARCERLREVQQDFKNRLSEVGGSLRLISIVDELFRVPVINIPSIARKYNISYPTARSYVYTLVNTGIIYEWQSEVRPKTFVCPDILNIIYD